MVPEEPVSVAAPEERKLKKVMSWRDGVAVALVAAAAGLTTIGPSGSRSERGQLSFSGLSLC